MSSPARAEAARINGAKSRGPVTPEGKAISARNATTHGMYTGIIVLTSQQESLFVDHRDRHYAECQPATNMECDLVDDIVFARWRILRAQIFETAALDREMDHH